MKIGVCYYPEHWLETQWKADAARMVATGISRVRIAEFAWSRIEPRRGVFHWDWLDRAVDVLAEAGLEITLCTPTATPPKWLIDERPDILATDAQGCPRRFGSRRHYCFSSTVYREESRRITEAIVSRYGAHLAVTSWQTDNEYGCHDTVESYSPAAEVAFREWLAGKYGNIDALNRAWGTVFWSQDYTDFSQVDLPNMTVTEPNPSHVLDFKRFSSDQVITFNREQVDIIRAHTSADITHNVMGHFTAFDHYALGEDLDIVTWDSYPLGFLDQGWWSPAQKQRWMRAGHPDFAAFHHDLYRSCGNGRWGVMEQQPGPVNWAPHSTAPRAGMITLWMMEAAAHGAQYTSLFRWQQAPFAQEQNHAGLLRPDGTPAPSLGEVETCHEILSKLDDINSAPSSIAVVFDYDSLWMLGIQPQGQGWHYEKLCFLFYTTARRLGLNVDVISPDHDLTGYKVVMVPSLPVLSDKFLERARSAGTHLFFGPRSGSKTADFHVAKAEIIPGLIREGAESLPPDIQIDVNLDEGFYKSGIWRDFLSGPLVEKAVARCDDGVPAFIETQDFSLLSVWPDAKLLRACLRRLCQSFGIDMVWLPKDLRVRHTDTYGFAFNYGERTHVLPPEIKAEMFVEGGRDIPPAGVAIWKR